MKEELTTQEGIDWFQLLKSWGSFASIATTLIYFIGFLSLRARLSALGISSNTGIIKLSALDTKYLDEGIRFLTALIGDVPIILLLVFIAFLLFYMLHLLLMGIAQLINKLFGTKWNLSLIQLAREGANPNELLVAILGIIFSLLFIQMVLRQCLQFSDVLLSPQLGGPTTLQHVLLGIGALSGAYFPLILFGVSISVGLFIYVYRKTSVKPFWKALFGFLVLVEFIFLPINFGMMVDIRQFSQVKIHFSKEEAETEALLSGDHWLIWEDADQSILLQKTPKRTLTLIPSEDIQMLEIIGTTSLAEIRSTP